MCVFCLGAYWGATARSHGKMAARLARQAASRVLGAVQKGRLYICLDKLFQQSAGFQSESLRQPWPQIRVPARLHICWQDPGHHHRFPGHSLRLAARQGRSIQGNFFFCSPILCYERVVTFGNINRFLRNWLSVKINLSWHVLFLHEWLVSMQT